MKLSWWRGAVAVFLSVVGVSCTSPNPTSCLDGFCDDPTLPFCDTDGSFSGTAGICIAVHCTAEAFETCRGNEALTCNAGGNNYDLEICEFGCEPSTGCRSCDPSTPDCAPTIVPAHIPDGCNEFASTGDLIIDVSRTIDTTLDGSCSGGIITQANGPELCVIHASNITIPRNQTLRVIGKRALALIADHDVTIDGVLDGSGDGQAMQGPGGGLTDSGMDAATPNGGGGSGFLTAGGNGGTPSADGGAGNGGPAENNPAQRLELIGGTRSVADPFFSAAGGAAGGGITIIACRGSLEVLGTIDVGGGGGQGAFINVFGDVMAAAGGGSGGNLVLQGMTVAVTGQLFANGGGGGAGLNTSIMSAESGENARPSAEPARGGTGLNGAGSGGAGGTSTAPTNGRRPTTAGNSAGAGGGSAGFLQTYSPDSNPPELMPQTVSPPLQGHRAVQVR